MYWVTQKLPQICTANRTTFPIRKCKITVTSGSPINLHTMLNKNLVYIKEILFLCNIEDFFFNLSVFLSVWVFLICVYFSVSTVWPKSNDSFYIAAYYIKWVTTSWTHSSNSIWKDGQDLLQTQYYRQYLP